MSKMWEYGSVYKKYPIPEEGYKFDDGSIVKVHNIFNPLPEFMKEADLIFVDPPWNKGNLNSFYTKADMVERVETFEEFYERVFECIREISPRIAYVEIGKEYLAEYIFEMKKIFKYVTFYNATYYHSKKNLCYVVRGSNRYKKPKLDGMDEEDIIEWVCENEDYDCIGDLCMGQGLVGLNSYKNKKRFVGTELNHKRLSVLVDRIERLKSEEN